MSEALRSVVLALADDELIIGHRHSEWTGFAPHIEEDVAFSSIAQDEIGHAAAYYSLVSGDPDALALGRKPVDYRHAVICERPNHDWSYTLARHWLYDHADDLRLQALERSAHEGLAALVRKIRREERYHLMHADAWLKRLARGPIEGRARIVRALAEALPESLGLFEPFEDEGAALEQGILTAPSEELRARFAAHVIAAFDELGLPTETHAALSERAEFVASSSGDLIAGEESDEGPAGEPAGLGGRRGEHSADFEELWDVMTRTYRAHPGASW